MKKHWCIITLFLMIIVSFSACHSKEPSPTAEFTNQLSLIMQSPDKKPQVSKDEFIAITNNYLSTNQWILPFEKACFHTSGINHSAYIIDNEYLFYLVVNNGPDGSAEYQFWLDHYVDGVVTETETDPSLFAEFIK